MNLSSAHCTASSQYSPNWSCKKALIEGPTTWASKGQGVGAWIEFNLPAGTNVAEVHVAQRNNKGMKIL